MTRALCTALILAIIEAAPAAAAPQGDIEAGRYLAATQCNACHMVSPNQEIPPIAEKPGPSFKAVANNPKTSATTISTFLRSTNHRWDPGPGMINLQLSDREIAIVSAYIMSLRDRK